MATCVLSFLLSGSNLLIALQDPTQPQLAISPRDIWIHMSWVGRGVAAVLLLMSIYSIAVMLERYLTFKAAAQQSREFAPKAALLLRGAQLDDALKLSQNYRRSHLAVVLNSGLQELSAQTNQQLDRQMRKAKRAVKRATALKGAELQRGLSALATVGSTAPFVGLLGTVIGIIDAFHAMGIQQSSGFGAVVGGISEALVMTAFGLLVAIPAVWMYNYFTNRLRGFQVEMSNSAAELIDFFLQQHETR